MELTALAPDELAARRDTLRARYEDLRLRGLTLDLTRGKPSAAQLDLADEMLGLPGAGRYTSADGVDCRNYGGLQGLAELREIFSPFVGVPVGQLVALGNSSLALMHDNLVFSLLRGNPDGDRWVDTDVAFLCPVPGYDRHFALLERYGIEAVPVPMRDDGPDMDAVEELVAADPRIRGMWCVPLYSNPTGACYAPQTVRRLASMPTAAADFRLFWDNAYAVHHLTEEENAVADVLAEAERAGNPNRPLVFASTSKITAAGSGVAFFGSSPANVTWFLDCISKRTIGPDKINQLRHVAFLRDADGLRAHMRRHRDLIRPKFELVDTVLREQLAGSAVASWTAPRGGYFISLDVLDGCARRTVELAREAGIAVTPAGATFPGGNDPRDRNIRIAPTYPSTEELTEAVTGLALCVQLAEAEKLSAG
jgi:DNA-binding transcriptional MocR family regulator